MAFRSLVLGLTAATTLSLIACNNGAVTPEGEHYHYVTNKVFVPATTTQAREFGLDLNDNGQPDNQLGMVLSTLASMGFDIQATLDTAVAEGSVILLADFQTKDFMNT